MKSRNRAARFAAALDNLAPYFDVGSADPRDYCSLNDAGAIAEVAPNTVKKWIDAGKVRGFRLDNRLSMVYVPDVIHTASVEIVPKRRFTSLARMKETAAIVRGRQEGTQDVA